MNVKLGLIISILFYNIGYSQNNIVKNNTSDYYNTKNIKYIFDLKNHNIKINDDKIYFNEKHGNISSPINYNNLLTEFNFNNIYQIKDSLNNTYYFRFGWTSFENNQTVFSNLEWIDNEKPTESENFIDYNFSTVDIDYIQCGKTSLCTIGDSQTWWSAAQNLRKFINSTFDDLIFIGSNTDIFGYGHEGEGGNNTNQLLDRINNIPKADYYTLLIGTNDWQKPNNETTFLNILEIINHLTTLNPHSKILYLTPIPTTNKKRDSFNRELSKRLLLERNDMNNQVLILKLGEKMRENKNWETEYLSDGLHLNINGVQIMAELIGSTIKTIDNKK